MHRHAPSAHVRELPRPRRRFGHLQPALASAVVALVALLSGCGDPAKPCCDCIVENECWADDSCPDEPYASCLWTKGDGELPAYASSAADVCFATLTECVETQCESLCE